MARPAATAGDLAGLLHAAAEGDGASWATLVDRFTGLLWSIARGYRLAPLELL